MNLTNEQAVELILAEVSHAETKHPNWPKDKIYATSIIQEETGESTKEANKIMMGESDASLENYRDELVQVAATAIRALKNI